MTAADIDPTLPALTSSAGASPVEAASLAGAVIGGRYELTALLGSGGMGTVYRAVDRELDEIVALKLLRAEIAGAPGVIDRFRREVKLARRVAHANVARMFELGQHEGMRFLTMEYVEGEPLSRVLRRRGRLPVERAVAIGIAVCDALSAAHEAGVIHRDIKPDNVLVEASGRVVVTDFGIARSAIDEQAARATGAPAGTPAYMAPEQLEGGAISPRTDLYALGAMLFEMLTGHLPWKGDSVYAVGLQRLHHPPPDPRAVAPDLGMPVASVVMRCMARDPGDRFDAASAVASALRQAMAGVGSVSTLSPGSSPLSAAPASRGARPCGLAVLPFRNSGEQGDEYLADSLTEDLLDTLCTLRGLRVLSRGATLRFRGQDVDAREAGGELGVDVVVEGSVRRTAAGLRVAARLIEVPTGVQVWAKRFDASPERVLGVQDEIARAIAAALSIEGGIHPREALSDPEALDLYLRARHLFNDYTPTALEKAIELFQAAHEREPDNAMISSGLSMALVRHSFFIGGMPERMRARASEAAQRAIAGAPHLGEPHLAMAQLSLEASDGARAARAARAAISRSPNLAEAHEMLGRLLMEAARVPDALRRLQVALGLNPRLNVAFWEMLRLSALDRDWPRFDRQMEEIIAREGGRGGRWMFHLRYAIWRGDRATLLDIERGLEHARNVTFMTSTVARELIAVHAHGKSIDEALALQEQALLRSTGPRFKQFIHQGRAELAAFAGRMDVAVEALAAADQEELFDLLWLERCPMLDGVRGEPGYARVLSSVRARAEAIADAVWG